MQTIEQLSTHYPHLSAAFATIPQGEAHLRRLQDLNSTWQHMLVSGATRQYAEVVVTEERVPTPATDTFDIIYAGGGLNLLNAAVMTQRYGLRVLVFDRFTVGAVHREWNISRQELHELLDVELPTPDELETVIQQCSAGFSPGYSSVANPLHLQYIVCSGRLLVRLWAV